MNSNTHAATSYHNPRIIESSLTNAHQGEVTWSAKKSLWISSMAGVGWIGAALTISWDNVLLFLATTAVTLCFGHSLGMHRRFIHQSYQCPWWLEYIFVYCGVLVGLAGPYGMMYTHDLRDWAQRQKKCHPYFAHGSGFLRDGFWQLHCDIQLRYPPSFKPEPQVANSRFYRFLEVTWMWQQLPIALLLYWTGGWEWVIWGVCLRVAVSVTGHWLIGYFAHNRGQRDWHVEGAAVQGYNIRFCGLMTMGECWHNNHHAFPNSAQLGLSAGQSDPGWWVLRLLEKCHLAWHLKRPNMLPIRSELVPLVPQERLFLQHKDAL